VIKVLVFENARYSCLKMIPLEGGAPMWKGLSLEEEIVRYPSVV